MGKGIALQFKKAFPENYKRYKKACDKGQVKTGEMFITETGRINNPKYIINFPTKQHWKANSKIEDVEAGLRALRREVERLGIESIALPPLGCGLGGLRWKDVSLLIEENFADLNNVKVIVYPPKGAPLPNEQPVEKQDVKLTRARALYIMLMDLYRDYDYKLGFLEIQKLAYFLQEAGEKLELRFKKDAFGPYANNLNHVLQRIEGHYIQGYGDRSRKAEIHPLPEGLVESARYLYDHPDAIAHLDRVARLIEGFETPYGLELLSTVLWSAKEAPMVRENPDVAVKAVQSWSGRKKELMQPAHIKTAWEHLKEEQWI
jgi:O-acetyl-ADP-ribose deacetylase (regulator of RNase III)